ncbi:MAG: response regulator, partial [Bacteroidales bacterium]|nr:response regulator [Bacteroidales bacterium]
MKIRCLLVDDEPLALDALESLMQKIPELEIIGKCQNAVEALQVIHNKEIDLLLLDIQMPEITGIEMLKSLAHPPRVIFTTAYREYAVEAFELDVIDYLVKPISLER